MIIASHDVDTEENGFTDNLICRNTILRLCSVAPLWESQYANSVKLK
jgi:hypothetical protein